MYICNIHIYKHTYIPCFVNSVFLFVFAGLQIPTVAILTWPINHSSGGHYLVPYLCWQLDRNLTMATSCDLHVGNTWIYIYDHICIRVYIYIHTQLILAGLYIRDQGRLLHAKSIRNGVKKAAQNLLRKLVEVDNVQRVPSGYLTVRHGIDGPFIDGLPIDSMVIFHGYVK